MKGYAIAFAPSITANWDAASGQQWTVPLGIGIGISRTTVFNRGPMTLGVQYYCNVERPDGTAGQTLRLSDSLLYPTAKHSRSPGRGSRMSSRHRLGLMIGAAALAAAVAAPAQAQLNTQHIKGSVGVKAGSQAPPGEYAIAPLVYFYTTDDIRNANGDQVPIKRQHRRRPLRRRRQRRHQEDDPRRVLWVHRADCGREQPAARRRNRSESRRGDH